MKFQLNYIFLCEQVIIDQSNKASFIGVFDKIFFTKLPGVHAKLYLVANFTLLDKNINDEFNISLLDDVKKEVPLNIPPVKVSFDRNDPKPKVGILLQAASINFSKQGQYKFIIYNDNKEVAYTEFTVGKSVKVD